MTPPPEEASRGALPPGARPAADGPAPAALLVLTLLLAGWAWGDVLLLPLTGEDWTILARLRHGGTVAPHLFRPWLDPWLGGLHALFGAGSPVPYHAGSLLLHGADVLLLYALLRGLRLPGAAATAGAALLALGAGATDALAWVAAVNRPLSTAGALVALNGAVRLGAGTRGPWLALVGGFLLQLGANEEAYGTALLLVVLLAPELRRGRRASLLATALLVAACVLHGLVLQPGDSKLTASAASAGTAAASFLARTSLAAHGLSLPGPAGVLLPALAALALVLAGRGRAALVLGGYWVVSFLPFVLSDPHPYRAYPTLAAGAALLGAGLVAGLEVLGARRPRTLAGAALAVLVLAWLGARAPRAARLARWRAALAEIGACEAALRAHPGPPGGAAPLLVNLEISTRALFAYRHDLDPTLVPAVSFLDAPTGFVRPPTAAPGPWFGRRCEGSLGWIDPPTYFAGRPELQRVGLFDSVALVPSLAAARQALARGGVDLARTTVVEEAFAPPGLERLAGPSPDPPGTVSVLAPLAPGEGLAARLEVLVRLTRPAVLAVREPELYGAVWRMAPDNALFNGLGGATRGLLLAARSDAGEELPTFPVDAYGLGVLLPAGERRLVLDVSLARPDALY